MTKSTTTEAPTTEAAVTTVLQHLDPADLLVDVNVRHDVRLDSTFLASVRDLGVLVPIVAVRTTDGGTRVRYGHRRALAAVAAKRPTVPVLVVADESTEDAAQVERLVGQYAENEHRTGLTAAEQVGVVSQLAAFGVSAHQIAKRTHTPRAQVDAALTTARSDLATAAVARYDFLTLDQAATVAEFEHDAETVKALVTAATTGQFDHVAQRARDNRQDAQRREQFTAALREQGVRVLDERTGTYLNSLVDADGTVLTPDTHRDCPGHAAVIEIRHGWVDPATGYPAPDDLDDEDEDLDDEDDDLDDEDDEDDDLDDDVQRAESTEADSDPLQPRPVWDAYPTAAYVCTDPAAHGHQPRWSAHDSGSAKPKRSEMTAEQVEVARAERRDVIESNKAWKASVEVRQAWLRTFLTRKTAPKGSAALIARALADDVSTIARVEGNHLTADLLGCQTPTYGRASALSALVDKATEARAQVLALAVVLAGYEAATHVGSWRHVDNGTRRYLTFLSEVGYVLSDVERRACGQDPLPQQAPTD